MNSRVEIEDRYLPNAYDDSPKILKRVKNPHEDLISSHESLLLADSYEKKQRYLSKKDKERQKVQQLFKLEQER